MFTVNAGFIGNFKLGDNIHHNLKILTYLYLVKAAATYMEGHLLRKPITILLGSVCEAVLYDLHLRMRTYTNEGVFGIPGSVLSYVRGKKLDKFELYISSAKMHSLLGPKTDAIYGALEELRKLRNRIHIQNEKGHFEPDEVNAYSEARQVSAEQTLEKMLKIISVKHLRPVAVRGHVANFQLPWNEYFP